MRQLTVIALTTSLGICSAVLKAGEVKADAHAFDVSISSLKTETKSLFYRGRPLSTKNPTVKYQGWEEAIEVSRKFPDTLSCLSFEPSDETVSLAHLNTDSFENLVGLELCLQRVGSELGDVSRVVPWLHSVGFERVEERPNRWLGPGNEDLGPHIFIAFWAREGVSSRRPYPMSSGFNLIQVSGAKNLGLELVIHHRDLHVLSAFVRTVSCDQNGENDCLEQNK